jgi:hypothetical protein
MGCPGLHCDGCGSGGLPVALIAGAAGIGLVTWFVLANLVVIAIGLAVAAGITAGSVIFLKRFAVLDWREYAPRPALPLTVTAEINRERHQAVGEPRQAIEAPAQHVHLHFHGRDVPAAHASIIRQAATPAAAAIKGDQS